LFFGLTSCEDIIPFVNKIADSNRVECEAVGFVGSESDIYKAFIKLKRNSSKEELVDLLEHDSLAIVAYASYALMDRDLIKPNTLLQRFINDEDEVSTACGCMISRSTLSSLIYHRYWSSRIKFPIEENYENSILDDSRSLQKMDSLVMYSKNPNWLLLSRVFDNRVYTNNYNSKIEEWAFDKNNFYALEYVFKNQKQRNENELKKSFLDFINNNDNHSAQKAQVSLMLDKLRGNQIN
jgi:hypothetical protein